MGLKMLMLFPLILCCLYSLLIALIFHCCIHPFYCKSPESRNDVLGKTIPVLFHRSYATNAPKNTANKYRVYSWPFEPAFVLPFFNGQYAMVSVSFLI